MVCLALLLALAVLSTPWLSIDKISFTRIPLAVMGRRRLAKEPPPSSSNAAAPAVARALQIFHYYAVCCLHLLLHTVASHFTRLLLLRLRLGPLAAAAADDAAAVGSGAAGPICRPRRVAGCAPASRACLCGRHVPVCKTTSACCFACCFLRVCWCCGRRAQLLLHPQCQCAAARRLGAWELSKMQRVQQLASLGDGAPMRDWLLGRRFPVGHAL